MKSQCLPKHQAGLFWHLNPTSSAAYQNVTFDKGLNWNLFSTHSITMTLATYLVLGQTWVLGGVSFLVHCSLFILASHVVVGLEKRTWLDKWLTTTQSHLTLVHLLQQLCPRLLSLLELLLHLLLLLQLHHLLVVVVLLPVLYTVHNLVK